MEPVIVIVGPTCSGKTFLSLKLAETLNTEIISADSRQVFKQLNIGTAKPSEEELIQIKHYFIDTLDPNMEFNASDFEVSAIEVIKQLHLRKKIPIVTGGSGLYVKALIDGIIDIEGTDSSLRLNLMKERERYGNEFMFNKLFALDPLSASNMLPQNWKRVIRALEVFLQTGTKLSEHHSNQKPKNDFSFIQYGLNWDRATLYHNIENRVDLMISNGLVEEVDLILKSGFDVSLNSLNTVGYKEIISFINNEISMERAIELIKRNTRRYAKRQMTWFRKDKRINWIDISSNNDLISSVDYILNDLKVKGFYEREN